MISGTPAESKAKPAQPSSSNHPKPSTRDNGRTTNHTESDNYSSKTAHITTGPSLMDSRMETDGISSARAVTMRGRSDTTLQKEKGHW